VSARDYGSDHRAWASGAVQEGRHRRTAPAV